MQLHKIVLGTGCEARSRRIGPTRTSGTLGHLLRESLDQHPGEKETVADYRFLAESFIIPALGSVKLTRLTQPGPSLIENFYAELRRCRRRCEERPFVEHRKDCRSDSDPGYQCDGRCKQHVCEPLGGSTLRHIHVVLNGASTAAVRWGWIGVNPLDMIPKPRAPKPQPNPPSAANAARIIDKAWATDAERAVQDDDEEAGWTAGDADVLGHAARPDGQDVGVDGGVVLPSSDGRPLAARDQWEHRATPCWRRSRPHATAAME